jgi:hypothetical protein
MRAFNAAVYVSSVIVPTVPGSSGKTLRYRATRGLEFGREEDPWWIRSDASF